MATKTKKMLISAMVLLLGLAGASRAEDLGTVFSYQGRLETAGSPPLNGSYDFKFRVYDKPSVGEGTQIGELMEEPNVPVTEGIFMVRLNPDPTGTAPNLFNGEIRYLEIAVRKTGSAEPYFTISPRQRIHAAPYAITASSARWLRGPSSSEKVVYVDDAGNVGIGTTSPTAKLEVNGTMKVFGVRGWHCIGMVPPDSPNPSVVTGPHYATSDGFVVGMVEAQGLYSVCWIEGIVADPGVGWLVCGKAAANLAAGEDNPVRCNSFMMPVKKGGWWQVNYHYITHNNANISVYWMPLGI